MMLRFHKKTFVEAAVVFIGLVVAVITSAAYSNKAPGNTEVALLLLSFFASIIVYYLRFPRDYITRQTMIEDVLLLVGVSLGPSYRLSVMKPKQHRDDALRTFDFVCQFRMTDLHNYDGKIKLSTHGAGQAYCEKRLCHLSPTDIDRTVDNYPNHVWSINVESYNAPRCVLNIDTSETQLSCSHIEHINSVITQVATAIAKYSPGGLPFIR